MIDKQARGKLAMPLPGMGSEMAMTTNICSSIICLSHLVERYANARLPSFGLPPTLTIPRVRLLLAVATGKAEDISTRMSDIALDLGVTSRTITTMVDALERDGLIERVPDANDRRAITLVLTDEGEASIPRIKTALDEIGAAVMSPLTDTDHEALHGLLMQLLERDS
ncbi:MAG: MarR family transcriptional regulator [Chloroflexota bacterium]|nr:MarR family transcriptional regulator [Chloroflexota bacterium]